MEVPNCYVATGVRKTRWVSGTRNHCPSGGAHGLGILTCLLLEGKWQAESLNPRDVNKAIKRDHYKTPTVEQITYLLAGNKKFTKVNGTSSYLCIVLDCESSLLTTFNITWGRYRFVHLPWGLSCAQDIFQRMMDQILECCKGVIGIANDVVIYRDDDEDHNWDLHNFRCRALEHSLVFNGKKCEVKEDLVTFFGTLYDANGAHPDPKKVNAIQFTKMPPPDN